MARQMFCFTYDIPSNRAVKCSLGSHKTLNRAHLGSCPNDDVSSDGMHYICMHGSLLGLVLVVGAA
jgi:hypothetical protein